MHVGGRSQHKRIDFNQTRIRGALQCAQFCEDTDCLRNCFAFESKCQRNFAGLKRLQPSNWIEGNSDDRFGTSLCDFFNFNSAFCTGDEGIGAIRTVNQDGNIKLVCNFNCISDQEPIDFEALRRSLWTFHPIAKHEFRCGKSFVDGLHNFYKPGFASTARMHLRLDDRHFRSRCEEGSCCNVRLFNCRDHLSGGDCDSDIRE